MIYVMSDLYGEYELFQDAIDKIDLGEEDSLFILGNLVDYGAESMDLLMDVMYRSNIYSVRGYSDAMAGKVLALLLENISALTSASDFETQIPGVTDWLKGGGRATIEAFMLLSKTQKEQVVEYLQEMELYEEISVKGQGYVLVHAGLGNFEEDKELEDYSEEELTQMPADYSKVYLEDQILVTGHTLTSKIEGGEKGKVYTGNQHIGVNCGCGRGGFLAVYCLDTGKAIYLKSS